MEILQKRENFYGNFGYTFTKIWAILKQNFIEISTKFFIKILEKFVEILGKLFGMNVAKILRKFLEILDKSWTKFIGYLKQVLNKILRIFGENLENLWEIFWLIISHI